MKKYIILLLVPLTLYLSSFVLAAERADVCVKYKKDFGWSKGYAVQGIVINGAELNRAVGSFTRFRPFSTYLVVFWEEGQASIFELPPLAMGQVPMFETDVEDQYGRKWKIKEGHTFCY